MMELLLRANSMIKTRSFFENKQIEMEWDIDRAKCKDGFIQIIVKDPKNT